MPNLAANFVHLGLGATASAEPPFNGMDWYADYTRRHAADGVEGRLVSWHSFSESWGSWEMHPAGAEVVVCLSGVLTLVRELPEGGVEQETLMAGDYGINPPGVWHTADVDGECTALFITAGAVPSTALADGRISVRRTLAPSIATAERRQAAFV